MTRRPDHSTVLSRDDRIGPIMTAIAAALIVAACLFATHENVDIQPVAVPNIPKREPVYQEGSEFVFTQYEPKAEDWSWRQ